MKTTMRVRSLMALLVIGVPLVLVAACDQPELETRTFRLEYLRAHEAEPLVEPYVFMDRERNPGTISGIEGAITVRETRDNLDRIERVLSEFDQPREDIHFRFQLIEADGFTESDPRIADVEDELRGIFQFQGYRLAAEAILAASDATEISQQLRSPDGLYAITGAVYRLSQEVTRLDEITLWHERSDVVLETTVSIRSGQTIVLGSAPKEGSTATLFLTVRAEPAASVDGNDGPA